MLTQAPYAQAWRGVFFLFILHGMGTKRAIIMALAIIGAVAGGGILYAVWQPQESISPGQTQGQEWRPRQFNIAKIIRESFPVSVWRRVTGGEAQHHIVQEEAERNGGQSAAYGDYNENSAIVDVPANFRQVFEDQRKLGFERPFQQGDPAFSILWPDYYIEYLYRMQAIMQRDGGTLSRAYTFAMEDEIFLFFEEFLVFLGNKGILSAMEVARITKSLNSNFPQSQTEDLKAFQRREASYDILRRFLALLSSGAALAQINAGAGSGDCYQDPIPGNLIKGSNTIAPCCDCCADGSVGVCAEPLGCLNAICPGGNAIWDPETGICGCDL